MVHFTCPSKSWLTQFFILYFYSLFFIPTFPAFPFSPLHFPQGCSHYFLLQLMPGAYFDDDYNNPNPNFWTHSIIVSITVLVINATGSSCPTQCSSVFYFPSYLLWGCVHPFLFIIYYLFLFHSFISIQTLFVVGLCRTDYLCLLESCFPCLIST